MKIYELYREVRLERTPEEIFPFFADARNLEELTPRFLRFRVVTPGPIEMRKGTRIDYALRVRGIPLRWTSEITVWEPPFRFVDEQRRGPYRLWAHEHRFEPTGDATIAIDRVQYAVAGGPMVHRLFVRSDVEQIFDHRRARMLDLFPPRQGPGGAEPGTFRSPLVSLV